MMVNLTVCDMIEKYGSIRNSIYNGNLKLEPLIFDPFWFTLTEIFNYVICYNWVFNYSSSHSIVAFKRLLRRV